MVKKVVPISQILEDAENQGLNPDNLMANPRDIVAISEDEESDDDDDLEENPEED